MSFAAPSSAASFPRALARRAGVVACASAVALLVTALERPAPADLGALASQLAAETGASVDARDVRWEPSSGVVRDLVLGRFALFLGRPEQDGVAKRGAPRDVFRARVRVSPEGGLLGVASVRNLTATPLGDDHALVVRGRRAAYATRAFGQEQSVTLFDLSGEGAQNTTTALYDRAMAWITNFQRTGSGEGIGRYDVTLDQPAQRVGLELADRALAIQLADDDHARAATRTGALDLATGELLASSSRGMHVDAARHLPKPLVFWAVDTVRAVPWIGAGPIAWLEEKTFALRDTLKQAAFKAARGHEALAIPVAEPARVLDTSKAGADLGHWPPPPIRSIWKEPEPGEGEWEAPKQPWIKRLPGAPSPFYETFVRPDEERPYAKVMLVAMDMRQLDLGMEAGSEDPKPLTGPPGTGRLPRDPAVYTRVAAAFNGGFKTKHGSYGMMVDRRVLLPPVAGAATVIVTKDHRVGMGSWGSDEGVGGIEGVDDAAIVSFRQNLDPLIDDGKVNPLGRAQWGFTLPDTSMQTERSGLCVTRAGHLVYVWGEDTSATTIGKAMKMASCVYGMHLDMNPHHTGFLFTNITAFKGRDYKSERLSTEMGISTDRYVLYAPKDFFYVFLHDAKPPALGDAAWEPDPGVQPAPAWMAGLWRTTAGRAKNVDVLEIEPSRATFRVRAGTREPEEDTGTTVSHDLGADDASRVLFALSVGVAAPKHHRGLVTDGRVVLPMSGGDKMGVLIASKEGALRIASARSLPAPGPGEDRVELPLVVRGGAAVLQPSAHLRSPAALGITAKGRVYLVRARAGAGLSDLTSILIGAGCTDAVLLDRGAGGHGVVARAGTKNPPRSHYDDTTLYAMGAPLLPRAFRFEAEHPVERPKKKK